MSVVLAPSAAQSVSKQVPAMSGCACSAATVSQRPFLSGRALQQQRLVIQPRTAPTQRQVTRMGLFGLGVPELAVIGAVTALAFGPSKLPELGKVLGQTVKSFQGAAKEFEAELKQASSDDDKSTQNASAKAGEGGSVRDVE